MPQIIIFLDEHEDKIVEKFSTDWSLSKHETIKKVLREYKNVITGKNKT